MPSVTFDDITGAVLGSRQPGRTPASPQAHVLGMMTRLGDVAALCGTPDLPTSPVERQELQSVIGELAVALCGLGAALDIDVGSAAASVARKRCERANTRASDAAAAVPPVQRPKRDTLRPNDVASPARAPPSQHSATSSAASHHRPPPLSSIPTASQPQSVQPSPAAAAASSHHVDAVTHTGSSVAPNSRQSTAVMGASEAASLGVSDATASPTTTADARYQYQQPPQQQQKHDSSESEERAKWGAAQSPPRAVQDHDDVAAALMSPKTTRSFFPELDRITALYEQGRLSQAVYDDLHLVWSVIDDHGEVIELIPRGCTKPVAFAEFPAYARMAEYLRHGSPARTTSNNVQQQQQQQYHTPPQQQQQRDEESASGGLLSPHAGPAPAPGSFREMTQQQQPQQQQQQAAGSPAAVAPPGFVIKRIPVEHHGENARGHFSPDHFKGGMFSPAQQQQYVDVAYPADEGSVPAGLTSPPGPRGRTVGPDVQAPAAVRASAPAGAATMPLTQAATGDHDGSPLAAGGPPPQAAGRPLTKKEEDAFWRKVAIIEAREATGNGIAALELTLTMPQHGRLEPLTTNGEYLPVTAANAQDFLNLLQEQRALQSGKLRRMDSVKTLAMPQPPSFNFKKETRLYGHDRRTGSDDQMLAPAPPPRTIFYVDFDEHAISEVEPPALKRRAIPQQLPSSAHYLDLIMSSPESFKDIYAAATRDPSLLQRLQVTFCVPDPDALLSPHMVASLPAGARPRCGLRDLMANGRNTRVGRDDWEKYSKLVLEASLSLPPSVAVHGSRK